MATQVQRRRGTGAENDAFVGALGEFTYDSVRKTIHVHDGETSGGFIVVKYTVGEELTGATKCKITYDSQGRVTGGADLSVSDIPDLSSMYVGKNSAITGATKCKITYDGKGLVTGGADLAVSDIPSLPISKVTDLQSTLDGKLPKISVITPTTNVGSVQLTNNAINKVIMTGSVTLVPPTVTDNTILNQVLVQLYKPNNSWTVGLTATHYFGTSSAPSITDVGYYNVYYEYDANEQVWIVGAIKKV